MLNFANKKYELRQFMMRSAVRLCIRYPKIFMLVMALWVVSTTYAFELRSGTTVQVICDTSQVEPVVKSALRMLEADLYQVLDAKVQIAAKTSESTHHPEEKVRGEMVLSVDAPALDYRKEAFLLKASDGKLYIKGSDAHGLAYGILEVSRLLGVSPWVWWADAVPNKKHKFTLKDGYQNEQAPSVEFRGIFVNDEDWGLMPWSGNTYEPSPVKGHIGPKTHARIFELLLRLRANTYWPAMHECTRPFFLTEGNREMARQYGIYIGGSHCEPMASNAAGEWKIRGKGSYDYVHNKDSVYRFWEERVREVADQPILYTIGMRGVHDGAMQGAKGVKEQKAVLGQVFKDQRHLLATYVNNDSTQVPQLFIPYKEVLDVYHAGLEVPEDVCLVWCDDNYGMVRHFPTAEERLRKGGNGIYYHVSYWGRPHDYLWLGTFSPSLLFQQMSMAWHKGIQKFWILNVGDIKPAEYQIELFLDMAWNMQGIYHGDTPDSELQPNNKWLLEHEENFYAREFGKEMAKEMLPVMQEAYRLAYIRKPEFMGNTRTEERDTKFKVISDLPWSENVIRLRLKDYQRLSDQVEKIEKSMLYVAIAKGEIAKEKRDTYFQWFKYPIQAAAQMNNKLLYAQLARHGKEDWKKSDEAFDSIARLTKDYNEGFENHGKWNRIMDFQPRKLPVFNRVPHTTTSQPMVADESYLAQWNGADCSKGKPLPWYGLGYEGKAVGIAKGQELDFELPSKLLGKADSVVIEVRMVPTHPVDGNQLRFALSLDGGIPVVKTYQTVGRSEQWKVNTLQCQAVSVITLPLSRLKTHHVCVKALDEGVILDQVRVIKTKLK